MTLDVVVIGAGLAGTLSALEARARGASVAIIGAGTGASDLCCGVWDARTDAGRDALELTLTRLPGVLAPASKQHCLLVGELGGLREAPARDPAQLDLRELERGRIAVANFAGHPVLDGRYLARVLDRSALEAGDARRYAGVEIDFFRRGRDRLLHGHELAAELDVDPRDPKRGRDARYILSEAIRAALGGMSFDAVLLPPVLGLSSDDVRAELEAALGLPVGEAVGHLPGAAAARLQRRLRALLVASEVTLHPVRASAIVPDGHASRVRGDGGLEVAARAIVLATGRLLAGGLVVSGEAMAERILGLRVAGTDRQTAGIAVDDTGRIAGPDAQRGAGLFACGSIAEGFDAAGEARGMLDVAASALRAGAGAASLGA